MIDDHPVVLHALVTLLRNADLDLTVLHAADTEAGLALMQAVPDIALLLLDLGLPGLSGTAAIDRFRQAHPALKIIVVSASESPHDVRRAIAHGASGYVPKSSQPATLLSALQLVMSGETYVPPMILGHPGAARPRLTSRQRQILDALGAGQTNREIAEAFGLSEKTVKAHVGAIFRLLNVVNRTQAAAARAQLDP